MSTPQRPDSAQVIERWQRPVFNLAFRMLGNRADAEDATQDVFERVVRNYSRYNPDRPLAPWVFRIARNVVLNHIRSRRSKNVSWEEMVSHHDDSARDTEVAISDALEHLDIDQQLLVSLHFFVGLTKKEIATVLSVPRTTIQSRMDVALGKLRPRLAHTQWAATPGAIESAMRSIRPAPVSSSLASRLRYLAKDAAGATATTTFTTALGGIALSKYSTALLLLGALMIGLGGYALGHAQGSSSHDPSAFSETLRTTERVLGATGERIAAESSPALDSHKTSRVNDQFSASADLATPSEPNDIKGVDGMASSNSLDDSEIPWNRMGTLLSDVIKQDDTVAKSEDAPLTAAEKKLRREFATVWFKGIAAIGFSGPDPFLDESILPAFVTSCFSKPLSLSEAQVRSLDSVARDALRDEQVDLEGATPVERHAARLRIRQAIYEYVDGATHDDYKPHLAVLKDMKLPNTHHPLWSSSHIHLRVGINDERATEHIVAYWKKAFALTSSQLDQIRASAVDLAKFGSDALRRLPAPNRAARFAELQSKAEARFSDILTTEQREASDNQALYLIVFVEGSNTEELEDF